jgi:hypothetical protein
VRNALAYALLNQNRHQRRRRVKLQCADDFTSARSFDGWRHRLRPGVRAGPAPVAGPRSWLLRVGWRRSAAGKISPYEVPGPAAR